MQMNITFTYNIVRYTYNIVNISRYFVFFFETSMSYYKILKIDSHLFRLPSREVDCGTTISGRSC